MDFSDSVWGPEDEDGDGDTSGHYSFGTYNCARPQGSALRIASADWLSELGSNIIILILRQEN